MTLEERTPARKLGTAILIAALLTIPLFATYLMVYGRQAQSDTARNSIAQGWSGPQRIAAPLLVLPYTVIGTELVNKNGQTAERSIITRRLLYIAATQAEISTELRPETRHRSIYRAVVYGASVRGRAQFRMPDDFARLQIAPDQIDWSHAELRFAVSDPRGLEAGTRVQVDGRPLAPQPGGGSVAAAGAGFFVLLDAKTLPTATMNVAFAYQLRGHSEIALEPAAGQTAWDVRSSWPHPSFTGAFLPAESQIDAHGFAAQYRISNLALGRTLLSTEDPAAAQTQDAAQIAARDAVRIGLADPADLYARINRAAKYGFLFIGFTFLAFLMFDIVGGHPVAPAEYLLIGAGLVLFFVMLLAFAEVIGFSGAYGIASSAIIALLTAYSAAVLASWRRAGLIAGLLTTLYAALYVLLSLEAYSLLIGSLMLFAALAGVMYLTRNLEWSERNSVATD